MRRCIAFLFLALVPLLIHAQATENQRSFEDGPPLENPTTFPERSFAKRQPPPPGMSTWTYTSPMNGAQYYACCHLRISWQYNGQSRDCDLWDYSDQKTFQMAPYYPTLDIPSILMYVSKTPHSTSLLPLEFKFSSDASRRAYDAAGGGNSDPLVRSIQEFAIRLARLDKDRVCLSNRASNGIPYTLKVSKEEFSLGNEYAFVKDELRLDAHRKWVVELEMGDSR
ncbi:hypothetical protein M427DRAFT_26834 [Gonapodya prolifera JEL478]|uniref:Uncharacterized protein n=1 Tax=Gonapodya prolifera (strain JEL478) TaxID=1344416 RepID=A0A139AZP4_GONPJ|nr:hypothetical protein M427DRAFT_26834 [Gonapodya prolifera JEL478]|eukprot:KXS22211.1 hypothetical protein M427DRAFT_26834 [Gonapodya prolifera JEL478]